LYEANKGVITPKCCWVRKVLQNEFEVKTMLICTVAGSGSTEERAWIKYGREEGWRLTNATDGGEGSVGWNPSIETRRRMSASGKKKIFTVRHRQNLRIGHTGLRASPETLVKLSIVNSGVNHPMFGKHHSEVTKLKMRIAQRRRYAGMHSV